jgi:hypothetical protein
LSQSVEETNKSTTCLQIMCQVESGEKAVKTFFSQDGPKTPPSVGLKKDLLIADVIAVHGR